MSNVFPFTRRPPEANGLDASGLITAPMADVYAGVMHLFPVAPGAIHPIARLLRFVARFLVGMVTGEEPTRPAHFGLTPDAALRRACDLLDLADEMEKKAESSLDESV